jgi:hypothetical protein
MSVKFSKRGFVVWRLVGLVRLEDLWGGSKVGSRSARAGESSRIGQGLEAHWRQIRRRRRREPEVSSGERVVSSE